MSEGGADPVLVLDRQHLHYLSVMRLEAAEREYGVAFDWQPFNVRAIITEIGNIPFQGKPPKLAYMWADIERRAAMYGIPARLPAPYPLPNLESGEPGRDGGPGRRLVCRLYARNLSAMVSAGARSREPSRTCPAAFARSGRNRIVFCAWHNRTKSRRRYDAATARARELGIFGSPSFATRGQLFWGDDRLEDAVSWHNTAGIRPAWEGTSTHEDRPMNDTFLRPNTIDPVTLEVLRNALESIADEMGAVLKRTSFSPNIKERMDASCAIFDAEAQLVAQAEHVPVHLGSMLRAVRSNT